MNEPSTAADLSRKQSLAVYSALDSRSEEISLLTACKNSSPCGKIYTLRVSRFFSASSSDVSMFLNFQGSYEFKVFLAAKVARLVSARKVSEHPPTRENRSSHNDNRVSRKEA